MLNQLHHWKQYGLAIATVVIALLLLSLADILKMTIFVLEGVLISVLIGALRTAQAQARKNFHQLQGTEAEIRDLNQALQRQVDELHRSEASYCRLFTSIDEGFFVLEVLFDENGTPIDFLILQANPALERHTGIANLVGKKASELSPGLEQDWIDLYAQVVEAGGTLRLERRSPWLPHWVDLTISPVNDTSMHQLAIVLADITDRKQAEIALRTSEARFRRLFECNIVPMGIWSATGIITDANDALLDLIGYTRQELEAGQINWQTLTPPEWIPLDKRSVEELNQHGFTPPWEKEYFHKQGHRVPILMSGATFEDNPDTGIFFAIDLTERKKAEVALQESQALFEAFMRNLPALAYIKDEAGRYLYVNLRNEHTFDYPLADWLGKTDFELFPLENAQQWRNHDLAVLATGKAIEIEEVSIQPDGNHYFTSFKFPIPLAAGRKLLGGMSLDVTERKRTERALQQSVAQLRLATEGANVGLWYWDIQQDKLFWTERCKALFGLPAETEMSYPIFLKTLHPDDRQRTDEAVRQCLDQHIPYDIEYRVRWSDGSIRWIAAKGNCMYDATEQPTHMMGIAIDITDRKRVEEKLREREEELKEAQRIGHFGSWYWDAKTDATIGSDELLRIFGFDPAHDTMPNFSDQKGWLYPHESWQRVYAARQNALETGIGYELDVQAFRQGMPIWITTRSEVVRDLDEKIVGLRGTVQDITARKQAEAEREQLLQREQAAREEAERANRIKDEFLSILSHELRSPLNPILGWSKLLQIKKLDDAKTAQALATIERNARLQTQLIDDLLDVAKILRGKLSLKKEPVHLASAIEAALEVVRIAAEAKAISLVSELTDIGQVRGDSTRLQQIVWNLLSNAIKFTPTGGRVEIRLEQMHDQAQISVTDTGKGISAAFLPHLFESFRQEDISITRQYGGLGLGLSIVKYLVDAHEGTVTADSLGEGQGATFTVKLPLLKDESIAPANGLFASAKIDLTGIKVLAVDDSEDSREYNFGLPIELGYDSFTKALYRQENQEQLMPSNPRDPKRLQWLTDKITGLFRRIFKVTKAKRACLISLSPNPLEFSRQNYAVDWKLWEQEGLVEELVLQVYRSSLSSFIAEIDKPEVVDARFHIPTPIGILTGLRTSPVSFRQMSEQVQTTRQKQFAGVSCFFYETLFYEQLSPQKIPRNPADLQTLFPADSQTLSTDLQGTAITAPVASQRSLKAKTSPKSDRPIRVPVLIALLLLAIGLGAALYLVVLPQVGVIVAK